ncbi:hypothetical protein HDK77DRAFT_209402 [Phyllosticta capitalensis]|uniref:Aminoglycoside phosphotransferase domain-containing protein n=1 Tax=Phyllosticta capitalensis TaxID=121624 RepID=A0ABR1Z395_9PEZI
MAIHLSPRSTYSGDSAPADTKPVTSKNTENDRRDSKADDADWNFESQSHAPLDTLATSNAASDAAAFKSSSDFNVTNSNTPAALAYWDALLDLCTPSTLIHAPRGYDEGTECLGRFIFAIGDVVVKTGIMPGEETVSNKKNYDGVDQNEVEAVELVKKKCGNAVSVADILFAGKLRGSSTLIQRRIEGPTLAAAWPSLTVAQRGVFKQQTRRLIAILARRVGASLIGKRAYLVDEYAAIWARNLTSGERRIMLPPAPPSRPLAVRANSGTVESVRRRDIWGNEGEGEEQGIAKEPGLRSKSFSGPRRDAFSSGNGFTTETFTRGDVFSSSNRKPTISNTSGTGFRRGNGFSRGDAFSKPPTLDMTSSSKSSAFNKPPTLQLSPAVPESAIITSPPPSTNPNSSTAATSPSISSPRTSTEGTSDESDTSFTHNDLSPSNIIISPDFSNPQIRALIDWEQAGWIGIPMAGLVHRKWRADVEEDDEEEKVGWSDLYDFDWKSMEL